MTVTFQMPQFRSRIYIGYASNYIDFEHVDNINRTLKCRQRLKE